jgi:hypothetical protein
MKVFLKKGWAESSIGKGFLASGRDAFVERGPVEKGIATKYWVIFTPSKGQLSKIVDFAEEMIKKRGFPSESIRIEISKVSLRPETAFIIRSNETNSEAIAEDLFQKISTLGEEIERKFFGKGIALRASQ